jgi:hypothetical protein
VVTLKNTVFWDFTRCGSCKNVHFMLQLLVTANILSLPLLVTLLMEAIRSSKTSVLTRTTWCYIPEECILELNTISTTPQNTCTNPLSLESPFMYSYKSMKNHRTPIKISLCMLNTTQNMLQL